MSDEQTKREREKWGSLEAGLELTSCEAQAQR